MTPEEKNEKVLKGSDIELDSVTILQNTDFSKEVGTKETAPEENPVLVNETPKTEIPLGQELPINTDLDQINASFEMPSIPTQETVFPPISNNIEFSYETPDNDVFSNAYDASDIKVQATVVTEEDEKNAKKAYMEIQEKMYDNGPGSQIKTLRNFSEEAAKWMRIVDKSGFVSGEMHDLAKKILREYEGLAPEENSFTDKEQNEMVQADPYGNIIPFNPYDSNNQKVA